MPLVTRPRLPRAPARTAVNAAATNGSAKSTVWIPKMNSSEAASRALCSSLGMATGHMGEQMDWPAPDHPVV